MKKSTYTFLQWTWGLPQTLIGAALYLANRDKRHFDFNGACATVWDRSDAVSLGKFIFLPHVEADNDGATVPRGLAEHEYGHSLQSIILGPAYLLIIGLPSVIWSKLPYYQRKRKKTGRDYYSPVFEKTANTLSASIAEKGELHD